MANPSLYLVGLSLSTIALISEASPRLLIDGREEEANIIIHQTESNQPNILQIENGYVVNPSPFVGASENRPMSDLSAPFPIENPSQEQDKSDDANLLEFGVVFKFETQSLRNPRLRRDDKRINKSDLESLARFNVHIMKDAAISGFLETELSRTAKRESTQLTKYKTKLELSQAYLQLKETEKLALRARIGRWLIRDEREWLIDENLDGIWLQWMPDKWQLDLMGGRVNYWQRDLLDNTSKNQTPVNISSFMLRREIDKRWGVGVYGLMQRDISNNDDRQINLGIRSHNQAKKGLRHWLELGMVTGEESDKTLRGYAFDVGTTYQFDNTTKPRFTLGYAWGSSDGNNNDNLIKGYRQTGLHSNEATFGGDTKFQIYGETLNPDLSNIHIFTTGLGFNISPSSTLDLVYHYYHQDRLAPLAKKSTELNPRYDTKSTKALGSAIDLIWGWKINDHIKLESAFGWFQPSKRFRANSGSNSQHSSDAYSARAEIEIEF